MSSTVGEVFEAAAAPRVGAVRWHEPVPIRAPGVYVVARTRDPRGRVEGAASISSGAVAELLTVCPEITVDGQRPTPAVLSERLSRLWLSDEPAIYIGRAGTSLQSRLNQYYRTKLGARSPHSGGWPVKCLTDLDDTWVHFGECRDPTTSEYLMLEAFSESATQTTPFDFDTPLPYANLEATHPTRGRRIKRHGIANARALRNGKQGTNAAR